jgi:alpha-1,3-rhamnosyltransferase
MEPLVSIIVISYFSAEYILETLESIKAQTYKRIELIITDDGSTDNTLDICREWLSLNEDRFVRTELLTVSSNTGIPSNCNRGLQASHGEWLKFIAGDDLLDKDCIINNMDFATTFPEANVIISKYRVFYSRNDQSSNNVRPPEEIWSFFKLSTDDQLKFMRFRGEHLILGMVIKRDTLEAVGGFDEKYRLFEDLPLLLVLLEHGNRFYFLPLITAYYRRNIVAVSNPNTETYKLLLSEMLDAYRRFRRPYLNINERIHTDIYFINDYMLTYFFKGRKSRVYQFLARMLLQFSPYQHQIRNKLKKQNAVKQIECSPKI